MFPLTASTAVSAFAEILALYQLSTTVFTSELLYSTYVPEELYFDKATASFESSVTVESSQAITYQVFPDTPLMVTSVSFVFKSLKPAYVEAGLYIVSSA